MENELYYNFETMKNSDNENIVELSETINLINISFFILIVLSILSYFAYIVYNSKKYTKLSIILMIIGSCSIVIVSILILFLNYSFIDTVESLTYESSTFILPSIKYSYITLILGTISLVTSIMSTFLIMNYSSEYFRKTTKKQKVSKNGKMKNTVNEETAEKKPTLQEKADAMKKGNKNLTINNEEIEDWLKEEVKNIEKHSESIRKITAELSDIEKNEEETTTQIPAETKKPVREQKDIIKEEETVKLEVDQEEKIIPQQTISKTVEKKEVQIEKEKPETEIKKEPIPQTSSSPTPFKSDVKKTETKITEEMQLSKSFDNVLSSVIEKRQKGSPKTDVEKQKIEPKPEEKINEEKKEAPKDKITLTVRCPGCKNVFKVEKTGEVTTIKCPKCGKQGIVK